MILTPIIFVKWVIDTGSSLIWLYGFGNTVHICRLVCDIRPNVIHLTFSAKMDEATVYSFYLEL